MGKIRLGNSLRMFRVLCVSIFLLMCIQSFDEVRANEPNRFITCNGRNPSDPTRLAFIGQSFSAPGGQASSVNNIRADQYFCIQASRDGEAGAACQSFGRFVARNPDNRQYMEEQHTINVESVTAGVLAAGAGTFNASVAAPTQTEHEFQIDGDTNRAFSEQAYYFCVPEAGNGRRSRCLSGRERYPDLIFRWGTEEEERAGGDFDRDCYCGESLADMGPCGDPTVLARRNAQAIANRQQVQSSPVDVEPETGDVLLSDAHRDRFNQCVGQVRNDSRNCRQAGTDGTRYCSDSNSGGNDLLGGAAQAAGALSGAHNQARIGTGAQAECFQASLLSNGALVTMRGNNTQCREAIADCDGSCGSGDAADYFRTKVQETCLAELNNVVEPDITMDRLENTGTAREDGNIGNIAEHYQDIVRDATQDFNLGRRACQAARGQQSVLENLIDGVGRSLQSAAQCSCQYASSVANTQQVGTSNACATNLPNPNACATNPSLPGCEVYRELSPCTPGATYNAQMCRCQTNPSAVGCEGTQTTGTVASMAGSSIRAGAVAGPTGFGIPAGGAVARNGIDLGGGSDGGAEGLQLDNKNGRAQIPKDPSVAGGGGAPPGGGATRDNGGLAGAGGEEKTLAAGLMNAAKNIGKALGLTKEKPNGNLKGGGKGGGNKEPNLNSFRPRNVAGGRDGMGGKHMDIWKMMNKCVQAETCQSNMNNYILTP